MTAPRLLDLFCCEGGAAVGYARAGWDVYGVDIDERDAYPFPFHKASAIVVMSLLLAGEGIEFRSVDGNTELLTLSDFSAVHASPPCQVFSTITPDSARKNHLNLIPVIRELLILSGLPYVIENVEGAKSALLSPMKLCGSSFGLRVRRHRYFESNVWLVSLPCEHARQGRPVGVYGDHPQDDSEYRRPDGTLRGNKAVSLADAQDAMGMPWATWRGCTEAIPPAYTEFLGHQLADSLELAA
jgi:DNA (cytosine-5)-methyltransferase 1